MHFELQVYQNVNLSIQVTLSIFTVIHTSVIPEFILKSSDQWVSSIRFSTVVG
jgi:hypothetical protein